MNIDDYRAMKQAEQEQQQLESQSQGKGQSEHVQTQPSAPESNQQTDQTQKQSEPTPVTQGAEDQAQTEPSATQTGTTQVPQVVEIDGKEVSIDELKNGYLRQSDYTKKTQELASARRELEYAENLYKEFTKDPDKAKQLAEQHGLPYVDPTQKEILELRTKYEDLLLEKEVSELQSKYNDFNTREVLQFAYDRKIDNLEDAYHLYKSYNDTSQQESPSVDVHALKEQLRQELLAELQSSVDTTSIIQSGGDTQPVKDNTPTLSNAELKIARNMRMSPEEYVKWRNKK